ncbi:DUF2752 domain-containing protein [bacterium]|nr:DUF2752 domain-containing protein [bacterium]
MFADADRVTNSDTYETRSRTLSPAARCSLIAISLVILTGFAGARRLEPNPSGLGTHRQLGLAACPTLARTGRPCPTCGMTTAVAHLSEGSLAKAWSVQPAAVFIALTAAGAAIWAAASACRGRIMGFASGDTALAWWAGGSFVIAMTSWAIRWQQWAEAAAR